MMMAHVARVFAPLAALALSHAAPLAPGSPNFFGSLLFHERLSLPNLV
jgi:hypothetical protein